MKIRINALDCYRVLMTIFMVILHSLYTFYHSDKENSLDLIVTLCRTATIGFPLLAGILIGINGFKEQNIKRGFILVLIFILLNLLKRFTSISSIDLKFLANTFILGDQNFSSFEIILPIGYALILSRQLIKIAEAKYAFILALLILSIQVFIQFQFFNIVVLAIILIGIKIGQNYNEFSKLTFKNVLLIIFTLFLFIITVLNLKIWVTDLILCLLLLKVIIDNTKKFKLGLLSKLENHTLYIYISQITIYKILAIIFPTLITNIYLVAIVYSIIYLLSLFPQVYLIEKLRNLFVRRNNLLN